MSETAESATQSNNESQALSTPPLRERGHTPETGKGVVLSDRAAQEVKTILEKNSYPDTMYLFVGVKGGGCSGLQYVLDLRDEAQAPVAETDEVFLSHDIPIVIDLKSFVVGNLDGTTIDYQEAGMMGSGFVFNNPNAKHTCGCGSSYTA